MGFFDSLKKGWSFMKAAFRMAGENKKLLLPSLYLILVTVAYYVAWVVGLIASGAAEDMSDQSWAIVGGIATLGSFIIFYFFCGVTVNMIDVHIKGGQPSVGAGVKDAGKNFVAILFLSIISTIVEMFARAGRSGDSVPARIIAGIVEAIWTVVAFLLLPAIIIEDASFGQAMRRVRDLHKGNMLLVGIGEVGVRLVTNLIAFVVVFLIIGVIYGVISVLGGGTAGVIVAFVLGGSMFALLAAFNIFLRMAYYTCLYVWAAEVEKVGQTAKARGPLGVALGHAAAPQVAA